MSLINYVSRGEMLVVLLSPIWGVEGHIGLLSLVPLHLPLVKDSARV